MNLPPEKDATNKRRARLGLDPQCTAPGCNSLTQPPGLAEMISKKSLEPAVSEAAKVVAAGSRTSKGDDESQTQPRRKAMLLPREKVLPQEKKKTSDQRDTSEPPRKVYSIRPAPTPAAKQAPTPKGKAVSTPKWKAMPNPKFTPGKKETSTPRDTQQAYRQRVEAASSSPRGGEGEGRCDGRV